MDVEQLWFGIGIEYLFMGVSMDGNGMAANAT